VKRVTMLAAALATAAVAVAGCSSSNASSGSTAQDGTPAASPACQGSTTLSSKPSGSGTLTVWLMDGSATTQLTDQLNAEFAQQYPGWKVNYQVQEWDGIGQKLAKALSSSTPPDVVELGNTQAIAYSQSGGLLDLTGMTNAFQCKQWVQALKDSGAYQGKQYAIPFYAANRTVIYRKDMFAKAGITAPPTSNDEWLADIAKLKTAYASDPQFQSLYLPGQEWYTLLSFIWDQGGDVATLNGSTYKAALTSAQARAGVSFYKQLYDASGTTAPKDTDEAKPLQNDVFAQDGGHVAMMIGLPWEEAGAVKDDPALESQLGAFPIPSKTSGKSAPVFLGGSDLAIAATSKNQAAAEAYLQLLSGSKYQDMLAQGGSVPGTSTDISALNSNAVGAAMAKAAEAGGKVTPVTPNWATVENGDNPLKTMMTEVLSGSKSVNDATTEANGKLDKILSAAS
jgi:N,N'-diacetylchitobiose transport system substrate-binding protein